MNYNIRWLILNLSSDGKGRPCQPYQNIYLNIFKDHKYKINRNYIFYPDLHGSLCAAYLVISYHGFNPK